MQNFFDLNILLPSKKCESADVGQPPNLRPTSIAKLKKFSAGAHGDASSLG